MAARTSFSRIATSVRPKGDATPVEQVLCDYFARSYREAALQTAEEIARATGVSKATVVRFASKLGFENFSHLRKRLQQIVAYDLSTVDRVSVEGVAAAAEGQPATLVQRIIAAEMQNLRLMERQLTREELERAARLLYPSRSVTVLGFRTSAALAQHAAYNLKKLLGHVFLYTTADSSLIDHLATVREGGVVLAIGFSRYDRRFIETVACAREMGYPIVAISEDYGSPLARLATVDLVAPATFESFVGAYAAPVTLITLLISTVAALMGDEALKRLEALEQGSEALRIFAQQLHELGVAADDVYTMVRDNPARLLGLSGSGTP